jgi:GH18 family chitinase
VPGKPEDGDNFVKLLQDYRNEWKQYENERTFILTVAFPFTPITPFMQDKGKEINKLTDFVNIMTYDMQVNDFCGI